MDNNSNMNTTILNWKEHIHLRPDVHVGSNEIMETKVFLFKDSTIQCVKEKVNGALLQCVREIVYNALDHKWRSSRKTEIVVDFDGEMFCVKNTGDPILLEKVIFQHKDAESGEIKKYELYYPEAYFGVYWTGSNYNEDLEIKTSGKNGMGAKIVNALSKLFYVECCDGKLLFKQSYNDKLSCKTDPDVKEVEETEPYVKIKFIPDYANIFKWQNVEILDAYLKKLCYDCNIVSQTPIYYNKELIELNSYKDYISLYGIEIKNEIEVFLQDLTVMFQEIPKGTILNITFANGNFITEGQHIRTIRQTTLKSICDFINKDLDIPDENKLKVQTISHSFFFYICLFRKGLQYTSQTKERVASNIEYSFRLTKEMEPIIRKWKLYLNVEDLIVNKIKKKFNPYTCTKLEDANLAGGNRSSECTLFVTEGLSAKSFAVEGISTLGGRDLYGVFPVKGKFLNVIKASNLKVATNKEVISLKTVLGIEKEIDYSLQENRKKLRYGRVDILTDNDADGKHIKALLLNFFHYVNKSLYNIGFVQCTNTPIVRIYTTNNEFKNYYSTIDIPKVKGKVKYYKGLGSHSSGQEVEDCFKVQLISSFNLGETCSNMFETMFATGYESSRRDIIIEAIKNGTQVILDNIRSCESFLKNELTEYQKEILKRNIPDFFDGLKETQRKVVYTLLEMPKRDVNVSKLAGIVSDKTNYHHGNDPLESVIVNLAQKFCGANNIPLLEPIGQFGTRNENGKDCSAGRYISVRFNKFFKKFFFVEVLTELNEEEGEKVEPVRFYPPIPYYLINGCNNISTGFKTFIPPYNIKDIIDDITNILKGKERNPLKPYYEGYKGEIKIISDTQFEMDGICQTEKIITQITEIPITTCFSDYKQMLKGYELNKLISNLRDYSNSNSLDIRFKNLSLDLDDLKLRKIFHLNSIYVLKNNVPTYYRTISDLIEDFVKETRIILEKRKEIEIEELKKENAIFAQKIQFIKDIRSDKIDVKQNSGNVIEKLKELQYIDLGNNYNYLTSLHVSSIFKDNIESLEKQLEKKIILYDIKVKKDCIDEYKENLQSLLQNVTGCKVEKEE